jgi:hypothetical protein
MELDRQPVNTVATCPKCGQYLQQMFDGTLRIVQAPTQSSYRAPKPRSSSVDKDTLYGVCCCVLIVVGWLFAFFYLDLFIY